MLAIARTQEIHVNAQLVTLVASVIVPILTGMLTKWNSKAKGMVSIVLVAAAALIAKATVADGGAVLSSQTAINWLEGVAVQVAIYKGLWKPLGITSSRYIDTTATDAGTPVVVQGKLGAGGVL